MMTTLFWVPEGKAKGRTWCFLSVGQQISPTLCQQLSGSHEGGGGLSTACTCG